MTRLLVSMKFAPCSETEALAVRHAADAVYADRVWRESFAADAWLLRGRGATVSLVHDGPAIGSVDVVAAAGGWWHADAIVESDDDAVLARCKPGQPVSVGAQPIRWDDDHRVGTRRHTLARLEHITILDRGQHPGYVGAKILSVRELASKAKPAAGGVNWRAKLPTGYEIFRDEDIDLQPGDELTLGSAVHGARWDGQRFIVHHSALRAA